MSNQILISSGAKLRDLDDVIIGTDGVLTSLGFNVANGVPKLDENGKILVSQLPNSVMEFKGVWNAATNTPTLANGTGNAGDVYLCNVAGTVNFGAGPITFAVGDYAVYTGTVWARSSGATGTVTSVGLSRSGDALTVTGSPITTSGTINIGFAGTNLQYINGAGNLVTFPTIATEAQRLITEVYNETGATLAKGSIVYINGGHGNLPTVTKAIATGDATSAQTYGIVQNDIGNNNNGFVVVIGSLTDLDTQAYPEGTQLYLSGTTAGAWTSTKPYAPVHLVYVAIVTRSHPTQGVVEVSIQNGYEMDELHNVAAQNPDNNDILQYKTSTSLWTKVAGTTSNIAEGSRLYFTDARARQSISLTTTGSTGAATYDNTTGVLNIPNYVDQYVGTVTSVGLSAPTGFSVTGSPVTSSGTLALSFASGYSLPTNVKQSNWDDAYTWVAAFPTQTGNAGKFLTTDGSSLSWAANPLGTVTSVAMSVPTGLTVTGSPITSAGTLAVTFTAGYSIPTNASQTNWDTAYTNRITSLTTTGSSGAATLISNTLNVPNYTLAGLGGQPLATNLTSLSGLTFASTSFVKMTAAGTFALDTNTYALASALGDYLPLTGGTLTGPLYLTGNTFTFGIVSQATGFDVYSTGNFAPHYSTNFTIYQGAIGSGAARMTMLSTGATTFVSTVTASSLIKSGGTASQYLMADGSVSTLTNPVTGTGTADYLSKFTTASTIAVSSLYENANKIYLNTTTTNAIATSSFTINGGSQAFVLYNGGVNGFLYGSSTAGGIALAATYDLRFETGDAAGTSWDERMRLFRLTGNLKIGYGSSPTDSGYKLDVNGSTRIKNGILETTLNFNSVTSYISYNGASSNAIIMGNTNSLNNAATFVYVHTSSSSNSNYLGIGLFSNDSILKLFGSGAATFSSSVSVNNAAIVAKLDVVSSIAKTDTTFTRIASFRSNESLAGEPLELYIAQLGNATSSSQAISLQTGHYGLDFAANLAINGDGGNVLIGTKTGVSGGGKVQVNGNVNINGVFQINGVTIGGGGGSGVTGSGTTNFIPKWTSSSSLGNSLISESASVITIANGSSDEVPLRLSTTTNNSRIGFGTGSSGNTYNISTGGYLGTYLGFWTNDIIRGFFNNAGILNLAYGLTMSTGTSIQFGGDTRYGLAKIYNASTGDMFGMEQVGSTQIGFTAAATRIFAANASTNFISLGWYTTATAFTDALRVIIGTGNTILGSGSDNGYKLQINGSASYAFGFLSVYRGSSSPNDILVGNSGSVFYIGGNTQVVGSVSASGGFFDTSDARLKTLVEDNYLLSSIANVKAKLYIKDGRKELGYYAQDLLEILPSAVKEGSDGFLSLSYAQVHTAKIAVIEDEVTILKNRVSELEKQLNLN
jgi:hypothetical protein